MSIGDIGHLNYPDWYRVERETEKTIKKLNHMKELSFYLKNPDEFIRRLAIVRIQELKLRESVDALCEILEDRLESSQNKELAAWTLKTVSLKWDVDLFISNQLLSNFTGKEKLNELSPVLINDSAVPLKYEFSSSLADSILQLSNSNLRSSTEVELNSSFSCREWLQAFSTKKLNKVKGIFSGLPRNLASCWSKIIVLISKKVIPLFKGVLRNFFSIRPLKKSQRKSKAKSFSHAYIRHTSIWGIVSAYIKRVLFGFFYVLFFPIRFVLRHRISTACLVGVLYFFFTYSAPGKMLAYKHLKVDLEELQNKACYTAYDVVYLAWMELKELTGDTSLEHWEEIQESREVG